MRLLRGWVVVAVACAMAACGARGSLDFLGDPEGGSGAYGGAGPGSSGSGNGSGSGAGPGTGPGTGAGAGPGTGTGTGPGTGTATGTGVGGGPGTSSSSGGGMFCPGFGDPCSTCLSTTCPDVYCACYENPDCFALGQCLDSCNGDEECNGDCFAAYESAISDFILASDCAGTVCSGACNSGGNVPPCMECTAQSCEAELNDCLADEWCLPLYDCLGGCPPVDLACQQDCYAAYGAGVPKLQTLLECITAECDAVCGG